MSNIEELFREIILDHYESPYGRDPVENPDIETEGANPSCGDEIHLALKLSDDKKTIQKVYALNKGCSISTAAASMMAQLIEGKSLDEARKISEEFRAFLKGEDSVLADEEFEDLRSMEGLRKFPVRIKCALLPFVTLEKGIEGNRVFIVKEGDEL